MKKKLRNIVSILGLISLVIGITTTIPSFISKNILGMGIGFILVIIGIILLSIVFGE